MERDTTLNQIQQGPAQQIVSKINSGRPITPGERKVLQDAMLRLPPTSQEWKQYSAALAQAGARDGGMLGTPQYSQVHGEPLNAIQVQANRDRDATAVPNITPPAGTPLPAVGVGADGGNRGPAPLPHWGPGGSGAVANSTVLEGLSNGTNSWDTDPVSGLNPIAGGLNAYGLEHFIGDPQYAAEQFANQVDPQNGSFMASYYENPMKAALALSQAGVLGTGNGTTLDNVRGSNAVAQDAMDFMQQMYGQGPGGAVQFPDINAIQNEIYNRALNTKWSQKTDENGRDITIDDEIDTTNNALYQVAAFMPKTSADWLASNLNAAAKQYKLAYGKGQVTVSYPQYLRDSGLLDGILGSQ